MPSPTDLRSSRRVPELDGIRGLAIVLVLVWHYVVSALRAAPATPLAYIQKALWLSWSGVDLFFVLSGFLIGGILMDNRAAQNYFSVFYIRRTCRIFPLYFAALALFWLCRPFASPALAWVFDKSLPWWSYATYTQNIVGSIRSEWGAMGFGVTWSLAVEEQFYAVLPLLIWLVDMRKLPYVLASLVALAPVIRVALFQLSGNDDQAFQATYTLLPCRMDALLIGSLCAWMVRCRPGLIKTKWLYGGLTLGGLVIASLTYRLSNFKLALYGYTVIAIFYACFLMLAVTTTGPIAGLTKIRWLRRLGILAYGLYMFHVAVQGLFYGAVFGTEPRLNSLPAAAVACVSLAVTLLVAELSWRFFEKRFVDIGHRKKYLERARAAVSTA